jgi:tRNA (guanosine-2'-O-)-methyltransferase
MTPEREQKFRRVALHRQKDLTVILENVTDSHNIGAVLRSCDAVGISEIFVLNTEPQLATDKIIIGKRTSSGARKWVDIHYYTDMRCCFDHVRSKCDLILMTKLDERAKNMYELDLTQPVALLFGNEHSGVSEEVARFADGNFIIPQMGMVESLNISVACAVTLYEACRQRQLKGMYNNEGSGWHISLLEEYLSRHKKPGGIRKIIKRKEV